MPLSPEPEWTLTTCDLVAHADGIVEAGEWDQVLWMLDQRVGAAEATKWVGWLSDEPTPRARMEGTLPPAPLFTESVLDKAWRMALADGTASDAERTVHDEIAAILGATPDELNAWRTEWLTRAQRRAENLAGFAALLAELDPPGWRRPRDTWSRFCPSSEACGRLVSRRRAPRTSRRKQPRSPALRNSAGDGLLRNGAAVHDARSNTAI